MKILAYFRPKLAKPFNGHPEGTPLFIASRVTTKALGIFQMIPPDPVSLSLNDAQNFIDRAEKIKDRMKKSKSGTIFSKKYTPEELVAAGVKSVDDALKLDPDAEIVMNIDRDNLYSYLQSSADAMTSIMTAVESFVNIIIPRDHKEKILRRGVEEEWNKIKIVRYQTILSKLEIVGRAYEKTDFKTKSFWGSYIEVKKLRDEFIHFKQGDEKINEIWGPMVIGLIDADLQKYFNDVVELIKYLRPTFFD